MKPRVYIDTSVIGGCLDQEFSSWSNRLFQEFQQGKKTALVSDLTYRELIEAPVAVQKILSAIPSKNLEIIFFTTEAEELAEAYLIEKVVGRKHILDAQHIALATVSRATTLVSWNFKQIVNLKKIHAFNAVNLKFGYPLLEIRSPREVLDEEEL